jgi:hypothetical protein
MDKAGNGKKFTVRKFQSNDGTCF